MVVTGSGCAGVGGGGDGCFLRGDLRGGESVVRDAGGGAGLRDGTGGGAALPALPALGG